MAPDMLKLIAPSAFIVLLAVAAVIDIVKRRIPNWTVAALIVVWVVSLVIGPKAAVWWSSLAAAGIVFVVTYGLYHVGWFGAGDSKLMAASALFIGLSQLHIFAIITMLSGGVLALLLLMARPRQALRGLTAKGRAEGGGRGVPYGVAIAIGAIATEWVITSLSQGLRPTFFGPLLY